MNAAPIADARFGVVMAAYNGATTIERAIDSVLAQSLASLQLVIVDDCSTDDTHAIAQRRAAADPRVRVLRTARNHGGPAGPKNLGLEHVAAPILAFCDQDDRYLPDKLQACAAVFDRWPETDLVFSDYWLEETDSDAAPCRYLRDRRDFTQRARRYLRPLGDDVYQCERFLGCMAAGIDTGMATLTVAVRRECLARERHAFSTDFKVVDDIDLWYRLAAHADIKYIDRPLASYTSSPQSLSARRDLTAEEAVRCHRASYARALPHLDDGERRAYRALLSRLTYRLAQTRFEQGASSTSMAARSFLLRPNLLALKLVAESMLPGRGAR
jgi:glycosyltransferase involved in cell wall biosynthesis